MITVRSKHSADGCTVINTEYGELVGTADKHMLYPEEFTFIRSSKGSNTKSAFRPADD